MCVHVCVNVSFVNIVCVYVCCLVLLLCCSSGANPECERAAGSAQEKLSGECGVLSCPR